MTATQPPAKFTPDGRIQAINPRTWAVIDTLDSHDSESVPSAIARARRAQREWSELSVKQRAKRITPLLARIVERGDHLAELIHQEHGKSTTEATFSEVLGAAEVVRVHLKKDPV